MLIIQLYKKMYDSHKNDHDYFYDYQHEGKLNDGYP